MNHKESSTWTEYLSCIKLCQWIQARYKLNFHKESSTWTEYLSYIKLCQWIQARYKLNFRYEIKLELHVSEKLYYGGTCMDMNLGMFG